MNLKESIAENLTRMTEQTKAHIESHARELYDSPHLQEKAIEAAVWGYELRDEEVARLEEWKKSAMGIMSDLQEIGKELEIRLGDSIHDKILPGIRKLKVQIQILKISLNHAEDKSPF